MTLKVVVNNTIKLDVDLVPCFCFPQNDWPVGGYRKNTITSKVTNCTIFMNFVN